MKDILVVGAGFSGAVVARELAEAGYKVRVIDKRNHLGGNAYDYINEHGIRVHKYGPHIFHTNNKVIVEWLEKFGEWVEYKHKVKALLDDGEYVVLPPNRDTVRKVGKNNVVDVFFRPYTKKMWGMDIEELDPSILERVPVRDDDNELYFPNDKYQMMPKHGYADIFKNIFSHENISLELSTEFKEEMLKGVDYTFNSMPIDEFFNYKHGRLPYRSIKFSTVSIPAPKILPVPTVNFTHSGPYTRITEWKNYPEHGSNPFFTTLTYEQPCDYVENNYERYYPVKDVLGENRAVYNKYKMDIPLDMSFIGRCGMYVYLDMHQAISSSLSEVRRFITRNV